MFIDLCHLHDKFYKPLPGNAVRICCPDACAAGSCLCGRDGRVSTVGIHRPSHLQCLVLVTSSALQLLEQGIVPLTAPPFLIQVKITLAFPQFHDVFIHAFCFQKAMRSLKGIFTTCSLSS